MLGTLKLTAVVFVLCHGNGQISPMTSFSAMMIRILIISITHTCQGRDKRTRKKHEANLLHMHIKNA
jgi:hypothetical protein